MIARVLERKPSLARRLADAFDSETGAVAVEVDRLKNVLRKIALGLWTHEAGELSETTLRRSSSRP